MRFENSEEGIPNLEDSEPLTVLEILRKKQIAPRLDRSRDDQGVVPRKPALGVKMQCLRIQRLGRMHAEKRAEDRAQILLGVRGLHRLGEPSQGHIEKFLHNLVADDALLRCQGLADELRSSLSFRGGALIERINEDIRIQKESIAHSIRPC